MADNIAIFRINYKSDFILTLESDAGWETPFCIKFWTGAPSQAYFAGYDGTTYTHCAPVDGEPTKLRVQFDDHHLSIGDLKFQIGYHFTVADFPTSVEDEVLNQASVIIEVDDAPAQVMLDFNGETAPDIEFSLPAYANEAQRIANEEQRIQNEQARISAENERISNEDARIAEEQQRISQEAARVSEFAQLKEESQQATSYANAAAALANEKAVLAQQKATYAQTQGDYAKAQGDIAKADHERAESDHTTAAADHTTAGNDHTRAESDHGIAADDHTRAESDHTRAESDHESVEVYVDSLGAFDISAYNATGGVLAKYADLTAALGTNGANIPDALRKGGMSVKFVLSSDNKYVEYFLTKNEWSIDENDWQKLNQAEEVLNLENYTFGQKVIANLNGYLDSTGTFVPYPESYICTDYVLCKGKKSVICSLRGATTSFAIWGYSNKEGENPILLQKPILDSPLDYDVDIPSGVNYIRCWGRIAEGVYITIPSETEEIAKADWGVEYFVNGFQIDYIYKQNFSPILYIPIPYGFDFTKKLKIYINSTDTSIGSFGAYGLIQKNTLGTYTFVKQIPYNTETEMTVASGTKYIMIFASATNTTGADINVTIQVSSAQSINMLADAVTKLNGAIDNLDFAVAFSEIGSGIFSGLYTLSSVVEMPNNTSIIGKNLTIGLRPGGKIIMTRGCRIEGVRFTGGYDLARPAAGTTCDLSDTGTWLATRTAPSGSHYDPIWNMSILRDDSQVRSLVFNNSYPFIETKLGNCSNAAIVNCSFTSVGGTCISIHGTTDKYTKNEQPQVSGCYFSSSIAAIVMLDSDAEFTRITNCHIHNCLMGIYAGAGNFNISDCIMKLCDCGLYISNNRNGLHGEVSSVEIAHCPLNGIYINGYSTEDAEGKGMCFTNVHVADAGIEGEYVYGVNFVGCRLQNWFKIESGARNAMVGCVLLSTYSDAYGYTANYSWLNFPDLLKVGNRRLPLDKPETDINTVLN